jgi:hypothetical protein
MVSFTCVDECPIGTYYNNDTMQCLGCEEPCYTCTDATTCLSCDTQTNNQFVYYFNNKCYEECPDVSVPSPSKVCVDCEAPCVTCTELPEKCLTCAGDLL